VIRELTLTDFAKKDKHSIKRGPFGGALKKEIFVSNGNKVYEQKHAIYKDFSTGSYYIDDRKYKELEAFKINPKDLIISCSGTIGKIAEVPDNIERGIINQALLKLSLDQTLMLNKYFIYLFESPAFQNKLFGISHGSGIKNFPPMETLKRIKFPTPPISIQRKIASILDIANQLREKDKALVAKYNALKQSLFLDMFGDPVSNPKKWEIKTIESLTTGKKQDIKRGPFGGALKKEIFVAKGYLVYEQFHALNNDFTMARYYITEKKFNELKSFEVKPGDIIISCSGVYLGKLAIIPTNAKKGIINQALLKITLDQKKMRNDFFIFHFSQKNFREKYFDANRGAGVPNFPPIPDFKKFPFIAPPILLQNRFADRVANIEKQKKMAQANLDYSEELFNGLLKKAFNGKLL
jgi:type I restriction enzyme S subunit